MKSQNTIISILRSIDEGRIDPQTFLQSLMLAIGERETRDAVEYIQRVEDWPEGMRIPEVNELAGGAG